MCAPVNSRAIHGPPNSPGGRLMPCRTTRSTATPAGRASKCCESTCLTPTNNPVPTSTRTRNLRGHILTCHNSPRFRARTMATHEDNSAWAIRDLAHVWHPCTQMKDHESVPMIPLRAGRGAWLEDFAGKRYLDGISSWWVNLFGHANPRIGAAVAAQLDRLEHAIFAGFTHEPAVTLAEQL